MKRALGLDALRGLAILGMVFSAVIPYGVLPPWMYHAQFPPPLHEQVDIAGLTWVDLVFPFFLFSLGAAIPLTLNRKLEQGLPYPNIILATLTRGALLAFFAIVNQHVNPMFAGALGDTTANILGILSFVLLFLIFARTPGNPTPLVKWGARLIGVIGITIILYMIRLPDGSPFSVERYDQILMILANTVVFGTFAWLLTRNNLLLRLAILGGLLAFRYSARADGWIQEVWNWTPVPWLYQHYYLQFLFIVIPGTIAGDYLYRWMNSTDPASTKELVRNLAYWGLTWLIIGVLFVPSEGGIKKVPDTMTWFLISAGLAQLTLVALTWTVDILGKQRWFKLLVDNGQNPMIAYVAVGMFIMPVLTLAGVYPLIEKITATPWLGVVRGAVITLTLALFVQLFTRRRIFWRT